MMLNERSVRVVCELVHHFCLVFIMYAQQRGGIPFQSRVAVERGHRSHHWLYCCRSTTFGFHRPSVIVLARVSFYPHGPGLGPKPSQRQPSSTALARPADFKSLSRRKPGQSRGFQAKPGRNITVRVDCLGRD